MTVRGFNLMFEPGKVLLLSKIEKIYSMQELILSIDLIINKYFFFIIVGMDKICFFSLHVAYRGMHFSIHGPTSIFKYMKL